MAIPGLSVFAITLFALLQRAWATNNPVVSIHDGRITGTTTELPSVTAPVKQYLGIPYASSPPKRFSPPQDPVAWSGSLEAKEFKPSCIQQFSAPKLFGERERELFNTPPLEESEDCLYLNVFTPSTKPPKGGWPVMVWLYGGTLQIGGSQYPLYNGASMAANQDVVFVSPNYRLGVFGFSGSPEIPTGQQNSGFLDQRKSLQWVRDNIQAFGGDPSKVTVFGQSAGALSVLQLIATPPHPLPFRAAILESTPIFGFSDPAAWRKLVKENNCNQANSPIDCMRLLPASQLTKIAEKFALAFNPVHDNVTSVFDARKTLDNGQAANVPMLLGSNSQEGRLFSYLFGWDKPNTNIRVILNATYPGQDHLQKAILQAYSSDKDDPFRFLSRYQTDTVLQCPLSVFSNSLPKAQYSIYRYFYNVSFPNLHVFPDSGVYHGSEIPIVLGNYPQRQATKNERSLSKQLQRTWAGFAKHPYHGPGWPKIGSNDGKELLAISRSSKGRVEQKLVKQSNVDKTCKVYKGVLPPL